MKQLLSFMFVVLWGCSEFETIIDPSEVSGSCTTSWYQTSGRVRQVSCGAGKSMEMTENGIVCRCPPPCPGGDCKK